MKKRSGYIVGGLLARGGMAEIFLGKSGQTDTDDTFVAIKRILPQYNEDTEFIKMFSDEARISMKLRHPNLVQVYDFQKIDGAYAMIMEFVNGGDLRSILSHCEQASRRLTVPMAVFVAKEAAKGLHFAHSLTDDLSQQPLGIIHRDISPQNIIVSFTGQVKVTDFGIAESDNKQSETKPGVVKGKYSYMSPEQVTAKDLDARTDVFSLAIVLWEMLAMRRLFAGNNEVDTIRKVQNCQIDFDLHKENPDVDEKLRALLKKALAKDPNKRQSSAQEFAKDLSQYLADTYPQFSAGHLASFLGDVMAQKQVKINQLIQQTKAAKPSAQTIPPQIRAIDYGSHSSQFLSHVNNSVQSQLTEYHQPLVSRKVHLDGGLASSESKSIGLMTAGMNPTDKNRVNQASSRISYQSGVGSLGTSSRGNRLSAKTATAVHQSGISWGMVFLVIGLLFVGSMYLRQAMKTNSVTLYLATNPQSVRITVDGRPVSRGKMLSTPIKIPGLAPGDRNITLTRPHYETVSFSISGHDSEIISKNDIRLVPKPGISFSPVAVAVRGQKNIKISINDGYFTGNAPVSISDLPFGKPALVTIYPDTGNDFRCRITPKATSSKYPLILTIDVSKEQQRCLIKSP